MSLANKRPNAQGPEGNVFSAHDEAQASEHSFRSDATALDGINTEYVCRSTIRRNGCTERCAGSRRPAMRSSRHTRDSALHQSSRCFSLPTAPKHHTKGGTSGSPRVAKKIDYG
jgi:hypothetical protein